MSGTSIITQKALEKALSQTVTAVKNPYRSMNMIANAKQTDFTLDNINKVVIINYINVDNLTKPKASEKLEYFKSKLTNELGDNFLVITLPSNKDDTFVLYNGYHSIKKLVMNNGRK